MNAPLDAAAHKAITRELFHDLPTDALQPSQSQHQKRRRAQFVKAKLEELARNIAAVGIQQPIVARPLAKAAGKFPSHEIVFGERRWLAARIAKLNLVPVIVKDLSDADALELQLVENLQREDEHPLVEAEGYEELMHLKKMTKDQVAAMIGKGRTYVYNRLALLDLTPPNRQAFYAGDFDKSKALLLAGIPVPELQNKAKAAICAGDGMPFRQAQQYVRDNFMLRLKDAPFPTGDEKLHGKAGSCGKCPKRTGNQPDLFEEGAGSKNPDVCTDPQCFDTKRRAWIQIQITDAKGKGITVITGAAAKKVKPHEHSLITGGYTALDAVCERDPKRRTVQAVLGSALKSIPTALVQTPKKGDLVPVIKNSELDKALKKMRLPAVKVERAAGRAPAERAREKKRALETAVRVAVLQRLHADMKAPKIEDMRLIAAQFYREIWHENKKRICRLWGWGDKPLENVDRQVNALAPGKVAHLLMDLALNKEVWIQPHFPIASNPHLFTVARRHGVRVDNVRRDVNAKLARGAAEAAFKKPKKK